MLTPHSGTSTRWVLTGGGEAITHPPLQPLDQIGGMWQTEKSVNLMYLSIIPEFVFITVHYTLIKR